MHKSNSKEILLWLARRRRRCRIVGPSMLPLLSAEDEVLVDQHAYRHRLPLVGDVVIAHHPTRDGLQIIKRIKGVDAYGHYQLRGDNPELTQNNPVVVPFLLIIGRVTSRFVETELPVQQGSVGL